MESDLTGTAVWQDIPTFEQEVTTPLEGEKVSVDSLLNREVAIIKFRVNPSSFYPDSDYAQIQVKDSGDNLAWFATSSKVLINQLRKLEEAGKLPIRATIKKVKRYYTLAKPEMV